MEDICCSSIQPLYSSILDNGINAMLEDNENDNSSYSHNYVLDGVFDCMHIGHFNAIRQAKSLASNLYIGVSDDQYVTNLKATPVFTNKERCKLLHHVKWVDHVLPNTPYTLNIN